MGCPYAVVLGGLNESIRPPVVDYLLAEAVFVGTGWSAGGWCIRVSVRTDLLILIGGASRDADRVLDLLRHEAAHAWLLQRPPKLMQPEAVYNEVAAAILAAAERPGALMGLRHATERDERLADDLARAWGGHMECGDRAARVYFDETARTLVERYGENAPRRAAAASRDAGIIG